jgi:hypothetical protein
VDQAREGSTCPRSGEAGLAQTRTAAAASHAEARGIDHLSLENKCDGLRYYDSTGSKPDTVHGYIRSASIEREIARLDEGLNASPDYLVIMSRGEETIYPPPREKELARRERLMARLELSQRYERTIKRVKRSIGLAPAEKKMDRLCSQQCQTEWRIADLRSTTRSDLAVKLAICKYYDREGGHEWPDQSVVDDVRHLLKAS